MTKIIFFGSSDYCLPVLKSLNANFSLLSVVTKSENNPVALYAQKNKVLIFAPSTKEEIVNIMPALKNLSPDLFVVADYGIIIPKEIFTLPKFKTINIHFSALPKFRGPSPVQYSILENEKESHVTVQEMAEAVDTGRIIKIIKYPYSPEIETTGSLYTKLFSAIAQDLPGIINDYIQNKIKPLPQDDKQATYSKRINRNDGFFPFDYLKEAQNNSEKAKTIARKLRAFTPWPGLWTQLPNGKRLKILKGQLEKNQFIFDLVQLEGKNPVAWKQFLEGYPEIKKYFHPQGGRL